ncbi:MAG: hypothetical protein QOJ28_791, partial [Mycobacterium sp.]|nr:hypothetical protein [Mycobacterium sp.]
MRRHPEIDEEPIAALVFGLGLPRTGSTALSFRLAQDPDIRYLRSWEAAEPCPPPSTVPGDDPRIPAGVVELWAELVIPALQRPGCATRGMASSRSA